MTGIAHFDFSGRTILVTGGGQGLGADIARVFAEAGGTVVRIGRAADPAVAVANSRYLRCDIGDDRAIDDLVASLSADHGGCDVVVNNACRYGDAGSTRGDWLAALDTNLVAPALLVDRLAPLLARNRGTVVNIGSIAAHRARAGGYLYPVSKAAMAALTRAQAVTLAPLGIRVCTVTPGWTWSPAIAAAAGTLDQADARAATVLPMARLGRGEELGRAVAFAASDAAAYMTGCELLVDGGYHLVGPERGESPRALLAGDA